MKKYIEFLENTNVSLENTIKDFTFYKQGKRHLITCDLECKSNHLQPLIEMGLKFDFSNKKVGFAWNQNHVGGTGNDLRISCRMDLEAFKKLSNFLRGDFRANLLNDCQLSWAGFPLKKSNEIKRVDPCKNERIEALKKQIRLNVHAKKYDKKTYGMKIVQKVLNK